MLTSDEKSCLTLKHFETAVYSNDLKLFIHRELDLCQGHLSQEQNQCLSSAPG